MNARASNRLPEFDDPPVSEVAISVEFAPLEGWRGPHAGLYWGRINADYPATDTLPPLPSQIEKFGSEFWEHPNVRIEMVNPEMARFWFIADPPTNLIQVQRDQFIINWRKIKGDEIYPRFSDELRPQFVREWRRFSDFVTQSKLGAIEVRQCEVTYVNELQQGKSWNTFDDALNLFAPWWKDGTDGFLSRPEFSELEWLVSIPRAARPTSFFSQPRSPSK